MAIKRLLKRHATSVASPAADKPPATVLQEAAALQPHPSLARRIHWLLLAATPTCALVGMSNYLKNTTVDVQAWWLLPATAYLLAVLMALGSIGRLGSNLLARLVFPPVVAVLVLYLLTGWPRLPLWGEVLLHLGSLWAVASVCYGELAEDRPWHGGPLGLYPWILAGVAVGGGIGALAGFVPGFYGLLIYPFAVILAGALLSSSAQLEDRADEVVAGARARAKPFDDQAHEILGSAHRQASGPQQKARDIRDTAAAQAQVHSDAAAAILGQGNAQARALEQQASIFDPFTYQIFKARADALRAQAVAQARPEQSAAAAILADAEAKARPFDEAAEAILGPARAKARPFEQKAERIRAGGRRDAHSLQIRAAHGRLLRTLISRLLRPEQVALVSPHRKAVVHVTVGPVNSRDGVAVDVFGFVLVSLFALGSTLIPAWAASGSNIAMGVLICCAGPLGVALCFGLLGSLRVFAVGLGAVILLFPAEQMLLYSAAVAGRSVHTSLRLEDGIEHLTRNGRSFTIHYRALQRGNTLLAWEPLDIIPHGKPNPAPVNNLPDGPPANPVGRAHFGGPIGLRKDERLEVLVKPLRTELGTYYTRDGPLGELFQAARQRIAPLYVAVLGLGAGTVAGHAEWGDRLTFYESDSNVVRRVWDSTKSFTYLSEAEAEITWQRRRTPSPGAIKLVPGEIRPQLAENADKYDVLIVDLVCFEGIPVPLLTQEAIAQYLACTHDLGLIVFHTSNHHRAVRPVLSKLAEANSLNGFTTHDPRKDTELGRLPSDWVLLTRAGRGLIPVPNWQGLRFAHADQPLWTDAFSRQSSFLLQIAEWQR